MTVGDDTSCYAAASEDGFTDDQAGKTDHDDTRAPLMSAVFWY
mgnify:CR=1 FL=1